MEGVVNEVATQAAAIAENYTLDLTPRRVLLFNPPVYDTRFPWSQFQQPVTLLQVAALLKQQSSRPSRRKGSAMTKRSAPDPDDSAAFPLGARPPSKRVPNGTDSPRPARSCACSDTSTRAKHRTTMRPGTTLRQHHQRRQCSRCVSGKPRCTPRPLHLAR
jgi:hypothetical protein